MKLFLITIVILWGMISNIGNVLADFDSPLKQFTQLVKNGKTDEAINFLNQWHKCCLI